MPGLACQLCSNKDLDKILDLGKHPPSDMFLAKDDLKNKEQHYPLQLLFCKKCKLAQLGHSVEPKVLFGNKYIYMSGYSISLKKHLQSVAEYLVKNFGLAKNDLAIDIGSNDGTLLEGYLPHGIRVLGVDPSKVAEVAIKKGIPTINDFFDDKLAGIILQKFGKAKVITGTNVFAHVRDFESLIEGVKLLLDKSGVFLTESHYLLDMVKKLQYDEIYLEHLRYYSVQSIINLFRKFDMEVFHVEHIDTHGGSIRVLACKNGDYPVDDSVGRMLAAEEEYNLNSIDALKDFSIRVNENRRKLRKLLDNIKHDNKKIVGVGAPAKGNTLLNFCKIGPEILDYLVETNEWKIGKYSPGMHIKIVEESLLFKQQPPYVLLLSWNIKDTLIPKLKENGYKGKIIVPNPEPAIIN